MIRRIEKEKALLKLNRRVEWSYGQNLIDRFHYWLGQDVIFMALDVEGSTCKKDETDIVTEMGISTLDTRHLSSQGKRPSLSSRSISFYREKDTNARRKFFFGDVEMLDPADLKSCLLDVFYKKDDRHSLDGVSHHGPKLFRNIVLVGHSLKYVSHTNTNLLERESLHMWILNT